jgi:protein-S-isoprenylcysteine O-methyltransferase Ste14
MGFDLTAAEFSRWFLAAYFSSVAIFYTIRVLAVSTKTGRSPVSAGRPGTRHRLHHTVFRLFRSAILVVCLARTIWPRLDSLLIPLPFLWSSIVLIGGNILLIVSFAAILYVHFYMAQDWRSGIDESDQPALVTTGPFAITRNPMFLLIQLGQLGLFLSLPSVFTLVCLIVGVVIIHRQVRLEEVHLAQSHGGHYDDYRGKLPRWLAPTRGRMRRRR